MNQKIQITDKKNARVGAIFIGRSEYIKQIIFYFWPQNIQVIHNPKFNCKNLWGTLGKN